MCEELLLKSQSLVLTLDSESILRALLRPFTERDKPVGAGLVRFQDFCEILQKSFNSVMSKSDMFILATEYKSTNDIVIAEYKKKLQDRKTFANSTTSTIALAESSIDESVFVDFEMFVKAASVMMEELLDARGGERRAGGARASPTSSLLLRSFEVVDALLVQLQELPPAERRRRLVALTDAFIKADAENSGGWVCVLTLTMYNSSFINCTDLDGFAVMQQLLSVGFKLPRIHRVQLLRDIEVNNWHSFTNYTYTHSYSRSHSLTHFTHSLHSHIHTLTQ